MHLAYFITIIPYYLPSFQKCKILVVGHNKRYIAFRFFVNKKKHPQIFTIPNLSIDHFSCSCCSFLGNTCLGRSWTAIRQFVHDVVDNPFFEWTILLLIFASSLSLCFEDINLQDNEELMFILKIVNMVFAVLFFIEMILKWIAFGLWRYFSEAWTCLDFVIVCVSN